MYDCPSTMMQVAISTFPKPSKLVDSRAASRAFLQTDCFSDTFISCSTLSSLRSSEINDPDECRSIRASYAPEHLGGLCTENDNTSHFSKLASKLANWSLEKNISCKRKRLPPWLTEVEITASLPCVGTHFAEIPLLEEIYALTPIGPPDRALGQSANASKSCVKRDICWEKEPEAPPTHKRSKRRGNDEHGEVKDDYPCPVAVFTKIDCYRRTSGWRRMSALMQVSALQNDYVTGFLTSVLAYTDSRC